ncbi:hypothetical protein GCM10009098_09950 [Rheinheimera aquimaris]|uniref:Glycosyl transferase family 51 domain-containing protein n=2 Tax=Rheinheimera aquimaris TaxID=412437 RepID=A0ABP3NGZ3_9GAMM
MDVRSRIRICLDKVDTISNSSLDSYVPYLVAAEDHRYFQHFGVDPIGVARAIFVKLSRGKIQGASTIEQQFVRVATEDYERSLKRKLREQVVAMMLSRKRTKLDIATAYLSIAHYGQGLNGLTGLTLVVGGNLKLASEADKISIVSRLKYPEPSLQSTAWMSKHMNRVKYIEDKLASVGHRKSEKFSH